MARTVSEIFDYLVDLKEADSNLNGLTSTLSSAIWRSLLYLVAAGSSLVEQYIDQAKEDVETIISGSAPLSKEWIRQLVFRYQYDATNPQRATIDSNYNVVYPVINEDYKIITRCSVKTDLDRQVNIKVAKNDPPEKLTTTEANDLTGYIQSISTPGVVYNLISLDSDKLFIEGDIYYDPLYASVISANVETGLNGVLTTLSDTNFDGTLYISELIEKIRSVVGVIDVNIDTIKCRPDTTAFGSATVIYDLATGVNLRSYNPASGYFEEESTSSQTWGDKITYIPS